jgi:hypothetical protein
MNKEWEEKKRKRDRARENRVKKVQALLSETLRRVAPTNADDFEMRYREMKEGEPYYHETIGAKVHMSPRETPAYEIYLVKKTGFPRRRPYLIMRLLRSDVDARVKNENMRGFYQTDYFGERIEEGIAQLQPPTEKARKSKKSKQGGLEKTLGIISGALILLSIFFLNGVTGNLIGTSTLSASRMLGVVLFVLGLVGAFIYLRRINS